MLAHLAHGYRLFHLKYHLLKIWGIYSSANQFPKTRSLAGFGALVPLSAIILEPKPAGKP